MRRARHGRVSAVTSEAHKGRGWFSHMTETPQVSEAEAIAVLEAVERGEMAATYWTSIDGHECYRLPNGWGIAIELDDGGWLEGVVEVWAGDGRRPAHAVDFPGLAAWRPSSVEAGLRMFGQSTWGTPRPRRNGNHGVTPGHSDETRRGDEMRTTEDKLRNCIRLTDELTAQRDAARAEASR